MVSLYDRLGGHVLKWSNLKGQQWGGATLPLQHDGEFFNIEIKVSLQKTEPLESITVFYSLKTIC